MKALSKILVFTAMFAALGASAQESVSSGVSRGSRTRPGQQAAEQSAPGVSSRMQQHYSATEASDADTRWMRVIYRELDLEKNDKNAALYYPEDVVDGNENLFRIMLRLLANNQIPAYEYLDGREVFSDDYRVKVGEMLSRFEILATPAKGSTEKAPLFTIDESDVPANEVLSYYIIERWRFDSRTNQMRTVVEAICPVLHRGGYFGEGAAKLPMFWVKMDDLKPFLQQQYVFTDDDNNLARHTYDDFFTLGMYDGVIYKTLNLRNRSMAQMYPDPDDLKRAQDSIQNRLDHYADNLWVPTREELITRREAAEAAAAASDSTEVVQSRPAKRATSTTPKRSSSRSRVKKEPKPKSSSSSGSSSAARSVRNRKR